MGWSVGFDSNWQRDIGYGVPCVCDHPDCNEEIDRGTSYVCGGLPYGGDRGCGLFFCEAHLHYAERLPGPFCARCHPRIRSPFKPKPDVREWINHKLTDESWERWRQENPKEVAELRAGIARVEPIAGPSSEPLSQNKPAASSESSVSVPKEQQ